MQKLPPSLFVLLLLTTVPALAVAPELAWSSYLGGSGSDFAEDVLVAGDMVYVVGDTSSDDFPGATSVAGQRDPFIAGISLDGSLRFANILRIGNSGGGHAVTLGPRGILLGGEVNYYYGSEFVQGLVARIDPVDGSLLSWEEFGSGPVFDLEVDSHQGVWALAGGSYWDEWRIMHLRVGLPREQVLVSREDIIEALDLGPGDDLYLTGIDIDSGNVIQGSFVERRTPAGELVFRTHLPGNGPVFFAHDLAVAETGETYVVGTVNRATGEDVFVAKLDAAGSVQAVRMFGGGAGEDGQGVALGPAGEVYVVGRTRSLDFPVRDAFQPDCILSGGQCASAFVVRLDSQLDLVWSSYLGGTPGAWGWGGGIDALASGLVIAGNAGSSFPLVKPFDSQAVR